MSVGRYQPAPSVDDRLYDPDGPDVEDAVFLLQIARRSERFEGAPPMPEGTFDALHEVLDRWGVGLMAATEPLRLAQIARGSVS